MVVSPSATCRDREIWWGRHEPAGGFSLMLEKRTNNWEETGSMDRKARRNYEEQRLISALLPS
ncbi:hypothetical protein ACLOJK_010922 [Asimina triloba]